MIEITVDKVRKLYDLIARRIAAVRKAKDKEGPTP